MKIIQEGAIFIADSHYPHHGDRFLQILQKIDSKVIDTPQLFLMGDNFDLLFGYNDYIQTFYGEAISLLQTLSTKIEIFYFEGNHDFCLKRVFPNIKVYSRGEQPVVFMMNDKRVALSHGDKYETSIGYNLYCKLLRNPLTLTLLKPFEKEIINYQMQKLSQKHICQTFKGFEARVEAIEKHYQTVEWVIEGHFHQAKMLGHYISLPSLACQGEVGILKEGKILFKAF